MIWAGIGARTTPEYVLEMMREIAVRAARKGWRLRTGDATGADYVFRQNTPASLKKVYGPNDATSDSMKHAARYHPAWDKCDEKARQLHGRNSIIMLGSSLSLPVNLVVCWTEGGRPQGGTGQGIRVAVAHEIPVFNLFHHNSFLCLKLLLE